MRLVPIKAKNIIPGRLVFCSKPQTMSEEDRDIDETAGVLDVVSVTAPMVLREVVKIEYKNKYVFLFFDNELPELGLSFDEDDYLLACFE